jgi:hypothetical protein
MPQHGTTTERVAKESAQWASSRSAHHSVSIDAAVVGATDLLQILTTVDNGECVVPGDVALDAAGEHGGPGPPRSTQSGQPRPARTASAGRSEGQRGRRRSCPYGAIFLAHADSRTLDVRDHSGRAHRTRRGARHRPVTNDAGPSVTRRRSRSHSQYPAEPRRPRRPG